VVNIEMDLIDTGWEEVDWIHLAQDRDQRQIQEHSNEILGFIKCRKFVD
jgi:hypothetical protein